jgi:hypothetical protein
MNQPSGLTVKEISEWVEKLYRDDRPPKEMVLYMSLKSKIDLDTAVAFLYFGIKIRKFYTDTKRAYDYTEITPYNKGNLWKIRCFYQGYYHVYYGTFKKAYCTTIQDAINFILKP